MIVYVESNFVLELALLQAECDACDRKPDKVAELKARGCRLIYAFQDGLQFIESQLG